MEALILRTSWTPTPHHRHLSSTGNAPTGPAKIMMHARTHRKLYDRDLCSKSRTDIRNPCLNVAVFFAPFTSFLFVRHCREFSTFWDATPSCIACETRIFFPDVSMSGYWASHCSRYVCVHWSWLTCLIPQLEAFASPFYLCLGWTHG